MLASLAGSLVVLALLAPPAGAPTSDVARFRLRPERVVPGTVLHYRKSNRDGSRPVLVSVFVAARDRVEVVKAEEGVDDVADVRARVDWTIFSVDELDAGVTTADGARQRRAVLRLEDGGSRALAELGEAREVEAVRHLPVAVYNFDLVGVVLALPHLADPDRPLAFGIVDPTFSDDPADPIAWKGRLELVPDGRVERGGVPCRRYRLGGEALGGRWGALVARAADGVVVLIESPVPDNPAWTDLRLELLRAERMTPERWARFRVESVGRPALAAPGR